MRTNILIFSTIIIITGGLIITYRHFSTDPVKKIYQVLDQYRLTCDIDVASMETSRHPTPQKTITGIDNFKKQLATFVQASKEIKMLLVGFPFKSANTDQKVFGYLPDLAERKSLEYLQGMLDKIKTVYPPGATITIFCDGVPFANFLGIPLIHALQYEQALVTISSDLPNIVVYTSDQLIQDNSLNSVKQINEIIDQYPPTLEQFQASISPSAETFKKRIALELNHPAGQKLLKAESLDSIISKIMLRQDRMRNYIAEHFASSDYIRLSAHFSADISKKLGITLSPSSYITPYHGVCVIEQDSSWHLEFKKDVNTSEYHVEAITIHGIKCPFFKHN